jgi:hypothetical protein
MYIGLHVKYRLFLSDFNKTWNLSTVFFSEKYSKHVFMKMRPCGQTDRHDKAYSRFPHILRTRLKRTAGYELSFTIFALTLSSEVLTLKMHWTSSELTITSRISSPVHKVHHGVDNAQLPFAVIFLPKLKLYIYIQYLFIKIYRIYSRNLRTFFF